MLTLSKEEKSKIIEDYKINPSDSGSPEVQIALMTNRLNYLTEHFSTHKKDHHSRTGLMRMVGRRKRLLEYLKKQDVKRYEKLIKRLKLRK
jgi:small subunit ribosomal protein S15